MNSSWTNTQGSSCIVTFYHDVEQDIDSKADPETCREMVQAFLEIENRHSIPVTYNLVGRLFDEQPDMTRWITDAGQELGFHSYHHHSDWNPSYFADEISLCRDASDSILGYRSPQSKWDKLTLKTLWEKKFLWNAEGDRRLEPYFIYKGLVRLPISTDDWPLHTGELDVQDWVRQFEKLVEERPYVAIGMHDCVASYKPEERLLAWEKILEVATKRNAIAVNFSEACDLFRRAALSKYYSDTAKKWNKGTQILYRTVRFKELIRMECEKLEQPVVVDLGSGGGVLTASLADLASRVYCVDNAPGMVDDIAVDSCVEACAGEVTKSGLSDQCADLVVCARVIEYLFWPERLADEIRRIAKLGATFIVTFPAYRGTSQKSEGPAPNRIRRYFTPEEINRWAGAIGPGVLLGVQYDPREPKNEKEVNAYRYLDEDQPHEITPTNYVYIGRTGKVFVSKNNRDVIPVSATKFKCSNIEFDNSLHFLLFSVRAYIISLLPDVVHGKLRRLFGRAH